jgi:magnesium-transporting ATPase (P-type)
MILCRLDKNIDQPFLENIKKKISEFSREGLRTLLVGVKYLTE